MHYLLINTNCSFNKGSAAQVFSTIKAFKMIDAEASFELISYVYELDKDALASYGLPSNLNLNVIGYPRRKDQHLFIRHIFHVFVTIFLCMLDKISITISERIFESYKKADVVIDLSGDSFSDSKGGMALVNIVCLLPAVMLRKPFVFYSQSIGPFNWYSELLARFCLNRAKAIIVREELSADIIKKMNIKNKNIFIRADCAFALDAVSPEQADKILAKEGIILDQNKIVVSFSMSSLMEKAIPYYILMMAFLVDRLKEEFGAEILMVPHVAHAEWLGKDDRSTQNEILKALKNAFNIHVIRGEYNPMELKGIIAKADIFIGCRMHSCIAALSSGVPTLALGWSHKYRGIMKEVGLDRFVVDKWDAQLECIENDLMKSIKEIYDHKMEIIDLLEERSRDAELSAMNAARIVMECLSIRIKKNSVTP